MPEMRLGHSGRRLPLLTARCHSIPVNKHRPIASPLELASECSLLGILCSRHVTEAWRTVVALVDVAVGVCAAIADVLPSLARLSQSNSRTQIGVRVQWCLLLHAFVWCSFNNFGACLPKNLCCSEFAHLRPCHCIILARCVS
mmetsp:Transcript_102190/g.256187  ORF Transcript_102190/g.256187 Transcript_102190/m.256187 type:complete len:143 (-) Transcript_102190:121-549(-)